MSQFSPPFTTLEGLQDCLNRQGYALLDGTSVQARLQIDPAQLATLHQAWDRLPADPHLRDGGRYRRRRHGSFIVDQASVTEVAHRAHWQPLEYNALHGGMERWFEPIETVTTTQPVWPRLLTWLGQVASGLRGDQTWYVEAHPFRIDTAGGIGRPTPEGAHRDGVDLVAVLVLQRHRIKGGESRIFAADGPEGLRFTLAEPASLMLLDDSRMIHETTPIQPADPHQLGWRDTLVLTYRQGGFQDGPQADGMHSNRP
jgi:hypothetical protein